MKKLLPFLLSAFIATGCATSGQALKEERGPLNVFVSNQTTKQAATIINEMSRYCKKSSFTIETTEFAVIKKTSIDYKLKNNFDQYYYWMRIEVEEIGVNQSKISIYNTLHTDVTRTMARQVEQWVNNNSRECVRGF